MSYSDFKLSQLVKDFGLTIHESSNLFASIPSVQASSTLTALLQENVDMAVAINTEKACSELIIAPVLLEIRRQLKAQISLFSGTDFTVAADKGLSGVCDFILSKNPEQFSSGCQWSPLLKPRMRISRADLLNALLKWLRPNSLTAREQ